MAIGAGILFVNYRNTEEWTAVEVAVQNLINAADDGKPQMVGDFVLSVVRLPLSEEDSDFVGGYSHFSTSKMPHIARAIYLDASEYFASLSKVE